MIIVYLIGGLGNQMFQYALGRKLSFHSGAELKFDLTGFQKYQLRNYKLNHFNIKESLADNLECRNLKKEMSPIIPGNIKRVVNYYFPGIINSFVPEENFGFNQKILKIKDNVYLSGYWQTEKYFLDIRNLLLDDFTLKTNLGQQSLKIVNDIKNENSVSIHIRRGDYIYNPEANRVHGVCSQDYYHQSIQLISKKVKNPSFYIFSDEPEWTKTHIIPKFPTTYIVHNPPDKDYEDLWLMSQCKHNIIANSSFSWWAAWLNINPDKIVIAPKKWFNEGYYSDRDIIPEGWIRK